MQVILEPYEIRMAALVGLDREYESIRRGLINKRRTIEHTWDTHIRGALGEYAACKALNVCWSGSVNTHKSKPDIEPNIEVRTRPLDTQRIKYDLIVRSDDSNDSVFVLVAGNADVFHVRGWICGADAKKPEWRKNYGQHGEEWFVPREALSPIEQLQLEARS
jgi:hypothetical protein